MGQVLHGSATTTHAIRAAIQRSAAPLKEVAARYGLNQKTVAKWRKRSFVQDAPMGPKVVRSTVLTIEKEAAVVAFRRHTLLPLDDCLYALQVTIPHLTRSLLHRCLQRHGISRLPEVEGDKPKRAFKHYPIGFFHIDIAKIRTEEGKLHLFVAIDRTSKFAFAQLHQVANVKTAAGFLQALVQAVPIASTLCSPTTASSSATPSSTAQDQRPATGCTCSTGSASITVSSTASPSPIIHGPTAKSRG